MKNSKIYKQADSRWGSLPYPTKNSSFAGNGCGCCACLHNLIELDEYKNWTPKELRPYMVNQGFAVAGKGTLWAGITKTLQHYGFKAVNHPTMKNIFATMDERKKKGLPCIGVILFSAGSRGGVKWTAGGHFVAFVDYKIENGKHWFYTKDSGGRDHDGWYCYENHMKGLIPQIWSALSTAKAAELPAVTATIETLTKLKVDGVGGEATVTATQRFFKTFEDGIISGQNKSQKRYYPALTSVMFSSEGKSTVVKELQTWVGATRDGVIGKETTKAWQRKLRDLGYLAKTESIDGIFGPKSMKAWQTFLNDQLFPDDKGSDPTPTKKFADNTVIDVSYVQDSIDWNKVKADGIEGAIIRCGYRGYQTGKLQKDARFDEHIKGAHAAGLKIGVYFFTEGINATEGKEEAVYTLNLIKKAGIPLDYPIAIDTEYINAENVRANKLSAAKRTEVIKAFCEETKNQGYEPMIYASLNWFSNNLNMSKLPYKIWCAQYYSKCQYKGEYVMWQYTSEGKVNGIKGVVDMNHCYIKDVQKEQKTATNDTKVPTNDTKVITAVAALSINELAKQVLEGKWGSGTDRKKNLEKAGYDYDKVQARVNELLADTVLTREEVIANMNAWAKKIAADNTYFYKNWKSNDAKTHECPICKKYPVGKYHGWNCIGFAIAVWHHGGGLPCNCSCHVISDQVGEQIAKAKTDAEALKIVKKRIGMKDVTVIRNNGKNVPKSKWQAGDIGLMFSGNTYKHMFYIMGNGKIADSSGRSNKNDQIAVRNDKNYSARVIIRWTGGKKKEQLPAPAEKKAYSGELPTTKLVKTNAEVIADAIRWAYWIAGDNSFHYGYTNKHGSKDSKDWNPNAHHNGCYFCGTNVDHGGRSKKGIKDFEKTYCCNPAVTAAYAHGGCDQAALKKCRSGSSYVEKSFKTSGNWKYLGKPKFSDLKKGDVLYWERKDGCHYALYLGGGKLFEASSGDDNKKGSKKWNNSIHIRDIDSWGNFQGAFRYIGSVNTTCCIYHGEVSKRVELLQSFLKWYGYDIAIDGLFGDGTLKAVKDFQKKSGITADGIVGPNTINAMKAARK